MYIKLYPSQSFMLLGQRNNQEDYRWPEADHSPASQRFFLVCDGVGGLEKGEVASRLVASDMAQELEHFDWKTPLTNEQFGAILDEAYNTLDDVATAENDGMATTFTLAAFHAGGVSMAHIGDSRIYHIRPGEGILYRTDDHSLVNSLVHKGMLSPEQATTDPRRNIITRYMAPTDKDQTRCMANLLTSRDVQAGDYFFLCTDGVIQCVDDDMLLDVLEQDCDNNEKITTLKQACTKADDNSTAILIQVEMVESNQDQDAPPVSINADNTHSTTLNASQEECVVVIASNNRHHTRNKKPSLMSRLFKLLQI